jgi:curved DNA-binding protein CbpA
MCLVMYFVWRNEGVQELFLGLLLFQAVPVMQEIMTFYLQPVVGRRLARVGAFAAWLTAFAMCVPIAGTFLWAMFDSKSFDRFVRRRNRKEYNGYWRKYEWFQGILGFVDDSGENPFQVLGVSQSATAAQIRKRFRDLSVKYHPDKTGNDPVKSAYFVKLQRAMEAITSGTADGKVNENALMERVSGTIHRCAELTPVIGMWLALSIWGAFVEFMQNRGKRKSKRRKGGKKKSKKKSKSEKKKSDKTDDGKENTNNGVESTQPTTNVEEKKEEYKTSHKSSSSDDDDDREGESSSGDEEDEDGDEEEEDVLPNVGPSFVGASVLSDIYGGQRRRPSAKGRASAGLRTSEPRTVGGRRIQTPIVMPHRGKDAVTNNTTKVNTDDDGKKSDDKKKEN